MKKAQITIFIALGVILIGLVGVSLFFVNDFVSTQQERVVNEQTRDVNNAIPIKRIVTACLEDSLLEGLSLIGKQGGVIYTSQGGPSFEGNVLGFNFKNESVNVSYGVLLTNTYVPPAYPYVSPEYSYAQLKNQFNLETLFGVIEIPKLCSRFGPNAPDNNNSFITCPVYAYGYGDTTIQEVLRTYTQAQTKRCLAQDPLNSTGFDHTVEVVFGENDVRAFMEIHQNSDIAQETGLEIAVQVPIRLKRAYQLLYRTIEADLLDGFFDKDEDYKGLRNCRFDEVTDYCFDEDLLLYTLRDVSGFDDVVRVEDRRRFVDGEAFAFQVGLPNRRPMLDYVYYPSSSTTAPLGMHLVIPFGTTPTIVPQGIDPDEDALVYQYSATLIPGLMNSLAYTAGVGCSGDLKRCVQVDAPAALNGSASNIEINVTDPAGLFDYQVIGVYLEAP